jgi:hypothetical protein
MKAMLVSIGATAGLADTRSGKLEKLTIDLKPVAPSMRAELERFQRQTACRKAMRD